MTMIEIPQVNGFDQLLNFRLPFMCIKCGVCYDLFLFYLKNLQLALTSNRSNDYVSVQVIPIR